MSKNLTERQKELLKVISDYYAENKKAPTYEEMKKKLNVKSLATIALHLKALQRKSYIQVVSGHRGIRVLRVNENEDSIQIPILGSTAAGSPILVQEHIKGYEAVSSATVDYIPDFLLEVKGDSMIDAGINNGDLVAVKKGINIQDGDIVVFMIDDESTVKRFYKKDNCIVLKPENKNYPNIIIKNDGKYVSPVGKVVGVIKKSTGGDKYGKV